MRVPPQLIIGLLLCSFVIDSDSKTAGLQKRKNQRKNSRNRNQRKYSTNQDPFLVDDIYIDPEGVPDEQRLLANLLNSYEPSSRPVFNASHKVTVAFGLTFITIANMMSCFVEVIRGWPDEQRLLHKLFRNYDTAGRPVYNASHTVTVSFGLTLTQIADMDEVNQVLTTNVWLEQEWTDERLKWDPGDYNGLAVLRVPCQRIWLPDVVLYNSADDFTEGFMQSKAMVTHEGNVFWPPPAKLRSSCKIDITFFPFDDQICKMKFGSWTYDGFQVDITNRSAKVDLANYVYSGEWDLLDITVVRNQVFYACCSEPYPDVTFQVVMRRRTLYYLFNIIFPCLWLTVLSLLGFWLPPDSGEKITLGITVLLAFSVFMLLIAESMPATSEFVPLIGIYLTVTMAMTSLSIVLTVFVLQLHHVGPHQKPVPQWIRRIVIDYIARIICMRGHLSSYYGYSKEDIRVANHADDVCLTSFIDSVDFKDNCNGRLEQSPAHRVHRRHTEQAQRPDLPYDKITNHLKILVSKHDSDDEYQDIINEWRLVAHIMDRFLFWLFLLAASLSSLTILVIRPMMKPSLLPPEQ